ncbi:MAG TPA: hypothetical protein VMT54_01150, partial [Candidatus Cybelea sp.]|nr:hypothetical protein [Candidatus Cybelea sp.]
CDKPLAAVARLRRMIRSPAARTLANRAMAERKYNCKHSVNSVCVPGIVSPESTKSRDDDTE